MSDQFSAFAAQHIAELQQECAALQEALRQSTKHWQWAHERRTYWKEKYIALALEHYGVSRQQLSVMLFEGELDA